MKYVDYIHIDSVPKQARNFFSSQWSPGTREGYAAVCNRLCELEIVVFGLIGGPPAGAVGECLLICISMALITSSGLIAVLLALVRRRAKSFLSGKWHVKNISLAVY